MKLKAFKYNKKLQNNFGISLINYKYYSGRYIEYEEINKGKELGFNDELIFEGEYLNGKRNGKGKEYFDNGNLKLECKYFQSNIFNKIKEKFKEYFNLKFEGEYLNGKKMKGNGYDKMVF